MRPRFKNKLMQAIYAGCRADEIPWMAATDTAIVKATGGEV